MSNSCRILPHDEGGVVRVETPVVREPRQVLPRTVRGTHRHLTGQRRPGLGGRDVTLSQRHVEVRRHLVLKQEGGTSLLGNCPLPTGSPTWESASLPELVRFRCVALPCANFLTESSSSTLPVLSRVRTFLSSRSARSSV